ncbi:bifunctional diguanylate cyclase/phosphodiesterase [Neorhizobium sp. T25_13]|uniref:putative bifunctional diguanylate cyclase/phosphodiesterase n=1 Tax=Neorhizobium sp. T25_13 TaxID=2093830 RepID=UPI000CF8C307|nr:EAL domain-containing protein [Neorhizobium sp. T25_13]
MKDFLESKAGRQLAEVAAAAMLLLVGCIAYDDLLLRLVQSISAGKTHLIIIVLIVAGLASFAYSVLRILDMRNEMMSRRKAFDAADHIATHDHLTKLPNRYAFDRFVLSHPDERQQETDEDNGPQTATVFSIDLDGFKKVNDLLGHQGGDILLKEVSRRICALAQYECVFRFGGDEFVAVARNLSPEKEELFAQLLIHSVSRPVRIGTLLTEVGASVGYARLPDHGSSLEEVCHRSDVALYEAKSRGHNQYCLFQPEMQEKVSERAKLEGDLRRAIDEGKIDPFYQPLINLRTGEICGFEALARWNKDGVFVSPQQFIAVAEETGLITTLFEQLLSKACRDAQLWPGTLSLSFNVSPVQMEDRLLVSRVLHILQQTGLQSSRLEIEITENALIDDPDLAAATIDQFHAAGIQVALDDFGTGYSSLAQLARFKFDKIKIDKSFVSSFTHNDKNAKIIDAVLGLSRSLNLKTTVEGIEENAQLAYFLGQGCDIGQGYIFGKAMPQSEVIGFVNDRKRALSA